MKWINALTMAASIIGMAGTANAGITFTMRDPSGSTINTDKTVTGGFNVTAGTWNVSSTKAFFAFKWTAHDGVLLHPGTYSIPTIEGGTYTGIQIPTGSTGGHILFDWNGTFNIDVVQVWDNATGLSGPVVVNGVANPFDGLAMIDGPFQGFNADFDMNQAVSFTGGQIPEPMSMALVGSALVGLVGLRRKFRA